MRIVEPALSYDDVLLAPKLGVVDSRSEVELTTWLTHDIPLYIPIVAAPMSTVCESALAMKLSPMGGASFIHRHMTIEKQAGEWLRCQRAFVGARTGCAIGLEKDRFDALFKEGCRLFCLDVAHAHSKTVFRFLEKLPRDIEIIVGSVSTREAIEDFIAFNENIIGAFRVGIGPGAACTTRQETGFGVPQLTAIMECSVAAGKIPVIADGGIKNSGDIVKALAAGASSVMLGRLLAGAREAPHPGKYWGMASEAAGNGVHIEGVEGDIPVEGKLVEIVDRLLAGVRSGISYGGGKNIKELQRNAEFIPVGHSAHIESGVRI